MSGVIPRIVRLATALLTTGIVVAVMAVPASATTKTSYVTDYASAYGAVHCVGKLRIDKKYPGNATSGGLEQEKCVSTEPSGKLTGYFTPGEEYTGYWESDYYATIAEPGVQPSSVVIKVAKNFKSFRVRAVYPLVP